MKKRFNTTGLCVRNMHYMVDTNPKMDKIFNQLIEYGEYFSILGGRQFGKTTTISLLSKIIRKNDDYLLIRISFEGTGDMMYESEQTFSEAFLMILYYKLKRTNTELAEEFRLAAAKMINYKSLNDFITDFSTRHKKKIVVIIDEVDKSTNSQIFLSFLGLLRDKYLARNDGEDTTFHSVILAGVHDIKTIKLKLRPGEEEKLNSPWNIAADLNVDLSFNSKQIVTLLDDFLTEHPNVNIPKTEVAEKIYYYTSGYPFLVSLMCKTIHEKIIEEREDKNWHLDDVQTAFEMIVYGGYTTTLFDSIAKNVQNDKNLNAFIYQLVINNTKIDFIANDKIIMYANAHAIIRDKQGKCIIHNRIFSQRLYDLLLVRMKIEGHFKDIPLHNKYYIAEDIDMPFILRRFQQFMREEYSEKDTKFLERDGRLLFLSYLKPIINGSGYVFKEPVVGDDRRMDIVVTHNKKRYVIELKIWRGEAYHQEGLQQMSDYLDIYSLKKGFLLIFNFNKNKVYKEDKIQFLDKEIFTVWT